MIHELKTLPEYFKAVISGEKTFEIRELDRPFNKGDLLALNEFENNIHTGRSCLVYVDYILNNREYVKEGYVVLGIKPCAVCNMTSPYKRSSMIADYSVPLATDAEKVKRGGTE